MKNKIENDNTMLFEHKVQIVIWDNKKEKMDFPITHDKPFSQSLPIAKK